MTRNKSKSQLIAELSRRDPAFEKLRAKYGADVPEQIKLTLIWLALDALIEVAFGELAENQAIRKKYNREWKTCSKEEQRIADYGKKIIGLDRP